MDVLSEDDRARLAAGRRARPQQLLEAPAFAAIVEDVSVGEPPAGVYHPTSTCRMGDVVDEDGAVVGFDHVFVVDASVFPEHPDGEHVPPDADARRAPGRRGSSDGGEQLLHRLLEQLGEPPHVGHQLAAGDEPEVEVAVVALHGHVEALAVGDAETG